MFDKTSRYLITTDNWFYAPDGNTYQAVWGKVKIVSDDILGIKTNRHSTNWFAIVGTEDNHVVIAGCQIHYAVKCNEKPNGDGGITWKLSGNGTITGKTPNAIYFTEQK